MQAQTHKQWVSAPTRRFDSPADSRNIAESWANLVMWQKEDTELRPVPLLISIRLPTMSNVLLAREPLQSWLNGGTASWGSSLHTWTGSNMVCQKARTIFSELYNKIRNTKNNNNNNSIKFEWEVGYEQYQSQPLGSNPDVLAPLLGGACLLTQSTNWFLSNWPKPSFISTRSWIRDHKFCWSCRNTKWQKLQEKSSHQFLVAPLLTRPAPPTVLSNMGVLHGRISTSFNLKLAVLHTKYDIILWMTP